MQSCNPLAPSFDRQEVINEGCSKWKTKALMGVLDRLILKE
jgi:hypothetical protein